MKEAPKPQNEAARLKRLHELNILDTPIEEKFERITRVLCKALDVPIAAISLIDEERQWFKSIQGLDVSETPRSVAFCAHAILEDEEMLVSDAELDGRFVDNPLVKDIDGPKIRFYAGYPLKLSTGEKVGTLCAIDQKPRELTPDQISVLKDLAEIVKSELLMRQLITSHTDLLQEYQRLENRLYIK